MIFITIFKFKRNINILIDSLCYNFYIMLMGDFNINISKRYRFKLQKQLQNFLHNIDFIHTLTPFSPLTLPLSILPLPMIQPLT